MRPFRELPLTIPAFPPSQVFSVPDVNGHPGLRRLSLGRRLVVPDSTVNECVSTTHMALLRNCALSPSIFDQHKAWRSPCLSPFATAATTYCQNQKGDISDVCGTTFATWGMHCDNHFRKGRGQSLCPEESQVGHGRECHKEMDGGQRGSGLALRNATPGER